MRTPSPFTRLGLALILLGAFALRLAYLTHSHPFYDEFTTVLASRAILAHGWPVLPSGLFYEHGLVFSYLAAPFVALAELGPSETLFPLARFASVAVSLLTVALLYALGRRWFSVEVGLLAAALFALSPEGMVWGGRARMYALAQLLTVLLVWFSLRGLDSQHARARWLALLTLLLALLTQLASIILVPPLLLALLTVLWLKHPPADHKPASLIASARTLARRAWPYGLALGGVLLLGLLSKRLGQPLGAPQLGTETATNPLLELWQTLAYQLGGLLDVGSAMRFLGRVFGVGHHWWLLWATLFGLMAFIGLNRLRLRPPKTQWWRRWSQHGAFIFLTLIIGLTLLEMVTIVAPFRRNPRYVVLLLPVFYLLTASAVGLLMRLPRRRVARLGAVALLTLGLGLHLRGTSASLDLAYRTPEPAYERAFEHLQSAWQAGDALLTMNASAVGLYFPDFEAANYGFAVQTQAEQFLLNADSPQPVDRWLGGPWVGTVSEFNAVLNRHPRTWFVVDTIRLAPTADFYQGDWVATLNSQMELVWAEDEALIYRTRPQRTPIPSQPEVEISAQFGEAIELTGYSLTETDSQWQLTLFWRSLAPTSVDYTVFVQLRDADNANLQGWDRQPLDGLYPTSQWSPGTTLPDPHRLDLPPAALDGKHRLALGLYQLETGERLPLQADTSGENALFIPLTADR